MHAPTLWAVGQSALLPVLGPRASLDLNFDDRDDITVLASHGRMRVRQVCGGIHVLPHEISESVPCEWRHDPAHSLAHLRVRDSAHA